ncbi:MAG: UvrY/SirA/GacA family response regulator transcription factor [Gammaproteobacteria bacterium]|nr:UvrY/SirA/GacA family response regulator transcription factor [Gammaproteobacteria bacterium]MDH5594442.1 UvrY/SirA/GacA family response regulator transcription factor [Gammaproteobacteria bacterium]MDH5613700.1 UvrY/SirA/GacA family response regulator transcription factor [Gammaproteobacteria bacterium]
MIKVLLVDDHHLVRTGIVYLLNDVPGMQVVGEADSGEEAIEIVKDIKPDVILMDLNMPGMGGLEATRKLLHTNPELKIIIVTVYGEDPFPAQLLKAGAHGYVTKDCDAGELVKAIRRVNDGQRYISFEVAQKLALTYIPGQENTSPVELLTHRELQVMMMLAKGQKTQDISDQLCISPKTVSTYRYRLYEKLGVETDVELAHLALRHGILDSNPEKPAIEGNRY